MSDHTRHGDAAWRLPRVVCLLLAVGLASQVRGAESTAPRIGDCERVYPLAADNPEVCGLAWAETGLDAPCLFVLDRAGKLFVYRPGRDAAGDIERLECVQTDDLAAAVSSELASPRGLAYAVEQGRGVLYFLDWDAAGGDVRSRLWRYDPDAATAAWVDLSWYHFRIGDREVFDVAHEDGQLLVSFDARGYADPSLRVQRGILRIAWQDGFGQPHAQVRHLPDAGTDAAYGLTAMQLDGARYLWATVGHDHLYCADAQTGRGLFFFRRPPTHEGGNSCGGLAFGQGALWVAENTPGPDRLYCVNVIQNPDAWFEGPRVLRRLVMTIDSEPLQDTDAGGAVFHTYSRPYGNGPMPNQGVWPETETIVDTSAASQASIRQLTLDPAGDRASRQILQCVEYADAPSQRYASRYEIDLWTNPYRTFVYPHRVDRDACALAGTDYLADDRDLYNLHDVATYRAFVDRVRAHIEGKYGQPADLQNPYWAARNVVEYIQDHYYYPSRPKRKPATVDYDRQHYDANPANLKIELSAREYDRTQIIACSGTSVMVAGAMRHLGLPARWLGTSTPLGPADWDRNANGLLDRDETATCTNGHRYTQVWLGRHYGWICFDATPSKPASNDYDPPPPLQSQWRYMNRAAAGHIEDQRIVLNVGSELVRPLYRDFVYDPVRAIDNNCGGDQRYNLQGRSEKPERWKPPRHRIQVKNLCFLTQVTLADPGPRARVAWQLDGPWERIPGATLAIALQQCPGDTDHWPDVQPLARGIPCAAGSATVDLSAHHGPSYRLILRREGDPATGGVSPAFDLD